MRRPKVVCLEASGPSGTMSLSFSRQFRRCARLEQTFILIRKSRETTELIRLLCCFDLFNIYARKNSINTCRWAIEPGREPRWNIKEKDNKVLKRETAGVHSCLPCLTANEHLNKLHLSLWLARCNQWCNTILEYSFITRRHSPACSEYTAAEYQLISSADNFTASGATVELH